MNPIAVHLVTFRSPLVEVYIAKASFPQKGNHTKPHSRVADRARNPFHPSDIEINHTRSRNVASEINTLVSGAAVTCAKHTKQADLELNSSKTQLA